MLRRIVTAGLAALLLGGLGAVPAHAAAVEPLRLVDSAITISAPPATPASVCDAGQRLDCGYVVVQATFSGLDGRERPAQPVPYGNLSGSARVTRVYGCETTEGRVLLRSIRRIQETVRLDTRLSNGFTIPGQGDTLTTATFGFLPDSQPGNCPAGSRATNYSIRADHVRLRLDSYWTPIAGADYSAPGLGLWVGRAPAPVPVTAPLGATVPA